MDDEEIIKFSKVIDIEQLFKYRNSVGLQTRKILQGLSFQDMKRKVNNETIAKIKQSGGVTDSKDSKWLLEFWSKKDIAGLLLMPITRHQVVHLNACARWKSKITKIR